VQLGERHGRVTAEIEGKRAPCRRQNYRPAPPGCCTSPCSRRLQPVPAEQKDEGLASCSFVAAERARPLSSQFGHGAAYSPGVVMLASGMNNFQLPGSAASEDVLIFGGWTSARIPRPNAKWEVPNAALVCFSMPDCCIFPPSKSWSHRQIDLCRPFPRHPASES
jgi:hypothetical protein